MGNITFQVKGIMETALQTMIVATFIQTLPENLRKEIEDKNYTITLSDNMITLYVTKYMCDIMSYYTYVERDDEKYRRFYDENGNLIEKECNIVVNELHLVETKTQPNNKGTSVETEPDSDMNEKYVWLEAYVTYNIPLENCSTCDAIRAAKKFAGE